jgi:5-methylcytosine-specific restriction enzyme A
MMPLNSNYLSEEIVNKYGIKFISKINGNNNDISIILFPSGLPRNEGFSIEINFSGRVLSSKLIFGNYAKNLVNKMETQVFKESEGFKAFVNILLLKKSKIRMVINNMEVNPLLVDDWPRNWNSLSINQKIIPITGDIKNNDYLSKELVDTTLNFVGLILSIMPLKNIEVEEETTEIGFPEGLLTKVFVNKYERNRINRQACISFYGETCQICGFSFEKIYGIVGRGFIHVHHLIPFSQITKEYRINPIKDLIPVCPNCHYMLHRKDPPYSPEDLIKILM